jgi:hypothetical protein
MHGELIEAIDLTRYTPPVAFTIEAPELAKKGRGPSIP